MPERSPAYSVRPRTICTSENLDDFQELVHNRIHVSLFVESLAQLSCAL